MSDTKKSTNPSFQKSKKPMIKDIPQEYKDSPLGIIPKEWEVKRLGDFSTFYSGGTPKS